MPPPRRRSRAWRLGALAGAGTWLVLATLAPSGAGAQGAAPDGTGGAPQDPAAVARAHAQFIAAAQLADGALPDARDLINPYFANLATWGLLESPGNAPVARRWIEWYIAHLNTADPQRWNIAATIDVYDIKEGIEVSRATASNVDANPATLLSVVRRYYESGDAAARAYVAENRSTFREIARVMIAVEDHGLTWARPDYRIKYLIDNCEVYQGYVDAARLMELLDDGVDAAAFAAHAAAIRDGINRQLWNDADQSYFYDLGDNGVGQPVDWNHWYDHGGAVSQIYPIVYGVVAPQDPRAVALYRRFNAAFPGWPELDKPEAFPWASVAYAAAVMGDTARVERYLAAVQRRYGSRGLPWPWHIAESGWLLKTLAARAAGAGREADAR